MAQYRKKPVVIDAFRWNGQEVEGFKRVIEKQSFGEYESDVYYLEIETLEGVMRANVGDYIITGVKGEKYPCKPDIFESTYEPA